MRVLSDDLEIPVLRRNASDFEVHCSVAVLARARASGASSEELAAKRAALDEFQPWYRNPVTNVAMTLLEPLPLAVLVTLASAGWLSRKKGILLPEEEQNAELSIRTR